MKVNRQDSTETNKTTAFWLYEFAHDLDKKAGDVDYLRDYLNKVNKNKKFSTIQEKLDDIKDRVGFALARKITDEIEKTSSEEKGCGCKKPCGCKPECKCDGSCGCKSELSDQVKTASKKKSKKKSKAKSKRNIQIMQGILDYIEQIINHEPHLDRINVLDRCKTTEGLGYNSIQHLISHSDLNSYINDLLSQYNPNSNLPVAYIPLSQDDLKSSEVAEYFNHAEPTRS